MTKWEYLHHMLIWQPEQIVLPDGRKLGWPEAWQFINELGDQGWELISVCPVAGQPIVAPTKDTSWVKATWSGLTEDWSRSEGDTGVLLFVFKRPK